MACSELSRRALLLAAASLFFAHSARAEDWQLKPFMLEDVNGVVIDNSTLMGRFSLVFFGYTSCPDLCPTTLVAIASALKSLGSEADGVLPLFVSLDPDRDTRKVLSEYTAAIDPRIVAGRGPKPFIDSMTANFGVTYKLVTPDPAKPDEYSVDHTATIFLIGPDGALIKTFAHNTTPDILAAEMRKALAAAPKQ